MLPEWPTLSGLARTPPFRTRQLLCAFWNGLYVPVQVLMGTPSPFRTPPPPSVQSDFSQFGVVPRDHQFLTIPGKLISFTILSHLSTWGGGACNRGTSVIRAPPRSAIPQKANAEGPVGVVGGGLLSCEWGTFPCWSTTLPLTVNLSQSVNFRASCGATLVTF